jgi:hypothetical protein
MGNIPVFFVKTGVGNGWNAGIMVPKAGRALAPSIRRLWLRRTAEDGPYFPSFQYSIIPAFSDYKR